MPSFISDEGVWVPSKERISLKNETAEVAINPSVEGSKYHGEEVQPGDDFIYEGPDRAALKMLGELDLAKQGYMGTHFTENPDLFDLARSKGYDNIEDYVKKLGYKSEKAKELVEKYKKTYSTHSGPAKVKGTDFVGGGKNTAGTGNDKKGGFGDPSEKE